MLLLRSKDADHATLGAGSDGTAERAERRRAQALVEAKNRIAQLHQALQQGGRPATSVGQVVDNRVLGRADKWDGSEKAWPK